LVAVLFVMSVVTLVALSVAYRAAVERRQARDHAIAARVRALTESAVAFELRNLATRTDPFDHPAQAWASHPPVAQEAWFQALLPVEDEPANYLTAAWTSDEEGKLNVRNASSEGLKVVGLSDQQAADLLDWMSGGEASQTGGASSEYYKQLPWPYRAKGTPVELRNELLMIRGFDLATLFGDFSGALAPQNSSRFDAPVHGMVTLLTAATDGKLNLNTAPEAVLATLPLSPDAVRQVIGFRRFDNMSAGKLEQHAFQTSQDIDDLQGLTKADKAVLKHVAVFKSHHFTILARTAHGPTGLASTVCVSVADGQPQPQVLQWDVLR
jgi:type II secretory pathway component PulK